MFQRWTTRHQVEANVVPVQPPMADCVLTQQIDVESQESTVMADATVTASIASRAKKNAHQEESTIEAVSVPSSRNVIRHEVEAQLYVQPFSSSLIESNHNIQRCYADLTIRD